MACKAQSTHGGSLSTTSVHRLYLRSSSKGKLCPCVAGGKSPAVTAPSQPPHQAYAFDLNVCVQTLSVAAYQSLSIGSHKAHSPHWATSPQMTETKISDSSRGLEKKNTWHVQPLFKNNFVSRSRPQTSEKGKHAYTSLINKPVESQSQRKTMAGLPWYERLMPILLVEAIQGGRLGAEPVPCATHSCGCSTWLQTNAIKCFQPYPVHSESIQTPLLFSHFCYVADSD